MCCWSVPFVGKIFRKRSNSARYAEFERLSTVGKTSYVLGSENWEDNFDALLQSSGA